MKKCTKCEIDKDYGEFCLDKSSKDGRAYTCRPCRSLYRKSYNASVKDQVNEYNKQYHKSNKEAISLRNKKAYSADPEKGKLPYKNWAKNNKYQVNEIAARKRTRKKQQTPIWANIKEIKEFYKHCPKGHHVDHVIPLRGKTVSGFHVLNNLQYLTASDNIRKGNRYEG